MAEIKPFSSELLQTFAEAPLIDSETELRDMAQTLIDVVERPRSQSDGRKLSTALRLMVIQDVKFAGFEDDVSPSSIADILTPSGLGEREKTYIKTQVHSALGSLLLNGHTAGQEHTPKIAAIVKAYDTKGLIREAFWSDLPMIARGAARVPTFLPVLHAKLTGGESTRIAKEAYKTRAAEFYLGEVLSSYGEDPGRNYKKAAIAFERSKVPHEKGWAIDPASLVAATNEFTMEYCSQNPKPGFNVDGHFNMLELLKETTLPNTFFRMASTLRSLYAPSSVRVAHTEQDIRHADIINILHTGEYIPTTVQDADIAIRFSDADPAKHAYVRKLTMTGQTIMDALHNVFASKSDLSDSIIFS